ncbi:hypothetical protein KDL44_06445 [bacterium]|nr:hypothetical protein [bacterium]
MDAGNRNSQDSIRRSPLSVLLSIWAVLAGYLTLSILVMLLLMVALVIVPEWRETVSGGYLLANILLSIISAAAGGYVTARIAPASPLGHGLALGLISLLFGVLYAMNMPTEPGRPEPPEWYGVLLAVLALPSVMLGALVRVRTLPASARPAGKR